mgnify:CR=1 FL=1
MSAIDVKLNVFEGPLDLLLHLIEKTKSIYTIFRSSLSQSSIWNM